MAKYISKEGQSIKGKMYGMSGLTQELSSPVAELYYPFPPDIIVEVVTDVFNVCQSKDFSFKNNDFNDNPLVWSTKIDPFIQRVKNIYDSI